MAAIARNRRSQEEIYKSLGLNYSGPSKSSGNKMIDDTPGYVGARNPAPSASEIQGMPKNPISFSGPPAAVQSVTTVGQAPTPEASYTAPSRTSSSSSSRYTTKSGYTQPQRQEFVRPAFNPGDDTEDYYDMMKDVEGNRPDPFQSRYEGAIQSILDGIMNRKSFDVSTDSNYNNLYNLYAQQYQAQANRGMRDTMGAMQAATGGYGSTAATAAAGQAYDRAMEGLNDRNLQLMQLAYQMYGDETTDRYNQLGAVTGLDNTDYARYRDTVGDWQADRAYAANQYQNFFNNDLGQYQFNTNLDYQTNQDANNWAWQQYQDAAERSYRAERDELSDYDSAFDKAYKLAAAGQSIPAAYANKLEPETVASLQALAQQALADKAAKESGGRSGRGGGRRSAANKSAEVMTGQPYASGLGYTANRNMVIDAINKQGDNQGKYNVIEDAVADGMITQEQGIELLRDAKVDLLKTTNAPDYIRRHYVDAGTKVKKKK